MNKEVEYISSLGVYMASYLKQRQDLDFKANDIKYILLSLDHFLCEIGFSGLFFDQGTYDRWLDSIKDQKASTKYAKISVLRRFFTYMSRLGLECYIPRLPRKRDSGFTPHIYSEQEMERIFKACDNLRAKERHTKSIMIIMPALIRLMYSTAIRVSEALGIKNRDVDFKRHVIVLNQTKNGSQRLAPLNTSMETVLQEYITYRNLLPVKDIAAPEHYLFVSSIGNTCSRCTISTYFERILLDAGIQKSNNQESHRLHDLRHSACVHSLMKMTKAGRDIYCSLPILATFMGHIKVIDTEHYLRLTQEMYPDLIKMDSSITSSINGIIKRSLIVNQDENI